MRIYFMGIGGTAMGQAALLAKGAGHEVLGADHAVYPPMSTVLADAGISVLEGYDAARLENLAPDLIVVGNALSRGHPEVEWLLDTRARNYVSLPAFLHECVLQHRCNIVVGGTHGKTTTTALAAFLLRENGRDPGFLIGGVPTDPPMGSHVGAREDPFVIEGDEYDSAFFDKRSKFIHYAPHVAVLNNLEFDHADIFRDLADVQRTFRHFTRLVPRRGFIVMNGDDTNLRALEPMPWTQIVRVGLEKGNDLRIERFAEGPQGSSFVLTWRGSPWAEVRWGLAGVFNARNAAMAACAAGLALCPEAPTALRLDSLARFRPVRRRQEVRASAKDITVIEDFGHHPTALAETLRSLRARYPAARLVAAFEPRSNTARTRVLQSGFARALAQADEVYLGAVNRAEALSEGERFDSEAVTEQLEAQGVQARWFSDNRQLLDHLSLESRAAGARPRVVVFFSNGNFDGIIERFVDAVKTGGAGEHAAHG